jgi:eukaryotic-like serine/threonine-protein kinase
MATEPKVLYEFGPFQVDPDKRVLLREHQPVAITPKAFEMLLALLRHSREVVTKESLMKALWPDAFVEEANLSQNIFVLRKALGDTPEDRRYIVTLPGQGYRFTAHVRTVMQEGEDLILPSPPPSQTVVEQLTLEPAEADHAFPIRPHRKSMWPYVLPIGIVFVLLALFGASLLRRRPPIALSGTHSILVADFDNSTGEPVFDATLRQGLEVQLEQSPYLSLTSDNRIQRALRMMNQPASVRLTPELAREICERTASAAVLEGSITNIGSQYVLGLRAKDCHTGDILDEEQAQAAKKEDTLNALTLIAAKLRNRVGESLSTIEEHDTPLAEATTPSLEALKAYSNGIKVMSSSGSAAALPFFKSATEIDPKFAMAYAYLGRMYSDIGESLLSADDTRKAYQLRDRVSDREKFFIAASYDIQVTGNLEKAQHICELWAQSYPRETLPHSLLAGLIYQTAGQYERAVKESTEVIKLDPDFAIGYDILAYSQESLGHIDQAENALHLAFERKLEIPWFLLHRYRIAFLKSDNAVMERIAAQATGSETGEIANQEAFVFAYKGQLRQAKRMSARAAELALQNSHRETAALWKSGGSLQEALWGDSVNARRSAIASLELSTDREVEYGSAFALALAGDSALAETFAKDLERRFPEDTSVRFNYIPTLRAQLALNHGQPSEAVELLQITTPRELGVPQSSIHGFFGALYPVYVRGEAYLASHQGAKAAVEFKKILENRGIVGSDPIGALAHLQLGRALASSGDKPNAKLAYQDFLMLLNQADPEIPILKQARAEYADLK